MRFNQSIAVSSEVGAKSMASEDDDNKPRKKIAHEIGQDLSLLSVEELGERIALLTAEIERLRATETKKRVSKDAADRFFKS
jgi:uncharacterized small protein (DUF1192 family)